MIEYDALKKGRVCWNRPSTKDSVFNLFVFQHALVFSAYSLVFSACRSFGMPNCNFGMPNCSFGMPNCNFGTSCCNFGTPFYFGCPFSAPQKGEELE